MGLIKVLEYGYNLYNKNLQLKIAIPKHSYISAFYVCNQDDVFSDNNVNINNYFQRGNHNYIHTLPSEEQIFKSMFTHLSDYTESENNEYSIYELNNDFSGQLLVNSGQGVQVSKDDLTFITLKLKNSSPTFTVNQVITSECGYDETVHTVVLYDDLKLKLDILESAKCIECVNNIPENFINKILQLKALELSICTKNFYNAAQYWIKYYKHKNNGILKKTCECNG